MDELRPDRDDVDQFKAVRGKTKAAPVSAAPVAKPAPAAAAPAPKPPVPSSAKLAANGVSRQAFWLLFGGLVLVGGGAFWLTQQWGERVQSLERQLAEAGDFISQNKLLMARFEGALSETGETVAESGSTTEKKIAALTTDLAKMTKQVEADAANITALTKSRDQAVAQLKKLQDEQSKVGKDAAAVLRQADEQKAELAKLQTALAGVQRDTEQGALEQKLALENLGSRVDELSAVPAKLASVEKQQRSVGVAIESIDASRLQFNERLLGLEQRMAEMSRSAAPAKP